MRRGGRMKREEKGEITSRETQCERRVVCEGKRVEKTKKKEIINKTV